MRSSAAILPGRNTYRFDNSVKSSPSALTQTPARTQSASRRATFAKSGSTLTRLCSRTRTPPLPQPSCSMVDRLANARPTHFRWKNCLSHFLQNCPGVEPRPRVLPDHLRLQLRAAHVRAGLRPVQQDPDQHRHRHHHHHQVDEGHDVRTKSCTI